VFDCRRIKKLDTMDRINRINRMAEASASKRPPCGILHYLLFLFILSKYLLFGFESKKIETAWRAP